MRFNLLAHIFLLASLALYSKAPWHQASPGALDEAPPAITVTPVERSSVSPQFQPPRLEPDRWNPCSACLTGAVPASSPNPAPKLSGMEWQCQECDTIHIGRTAYSKTAE